MLPMVLTRAAHPPAGEPSVASARTFAKPRAASLADCDTGRERRWASTNPGNIISPGQMLLSFLFLFLSFWLSLPSLPYFLFTGVFMT